MLAIRDCCVSRAATHRSEKRRATILPVAVGGRAITLDSDHFEMTLDFVIRSREGAGGAGALSSCRPCCRSARRWDEHGIDRMDDAV